jgi:hypothetical protein
MPGTTSEKTAPITNAHHVDFGPPATTLATAIVVSNQSGFVFKNPNPKFPKPLSNQRTNHPKPLETDIMKSPDMKTAISTENADSSLSKKHPSYL